MEVGKTLGDLVYENHGKVIGMRRFPNGKFEITAALEGTILGEQYSATWIGEAKASSDATVYVEFRGVFTTESGVEIPYLGIGSGINRPDGSASYRGAATFTAPPGKFASLNGMAVPYEVEIDDAGFIQNRGWEWK